MHHMENENVSNQFIFALAGKASKCGWTEDIEKEVIPDIFLLQK